MDHKLFIKLEGILKDKIYKNGFICQVCGRNNYGILNRLGQVQTWDSFKDMKKGKQPYFIPTFLTYCLSCGKINEHLLPKELERGESL